MEPCLHKYDLKLDKPSLINETTYLLYFNDPVLNILTEVCEPLSVSCECGKPALFREQKSGWCPRSWMFSDHTIYLCAGIVSCGEERGVEVSAGIFLMEQHTGGEENSAEE